MKKSLKSLAVLFMSILFLFSALLVFAGKKPEPKVVEVEKVVTVEKQSPYTFDKLLAMAKAEK